MENGLIDRYSRKIDYLRISVTDRCNLRCFYCMPPSGIRKISSQEILKYEELTEIIKCARELGIGKFRITGGEPLVRKGIVGLIEKLARMGIDFSLTTNGMLLSTYGRDLFDAGLSRINISLDTLKEDRFKRITSGGDIRAVFSGIDAARKLNFSPIKINVVVMRGINDDEIVDFIEWGRKELLNVRFIEFMSLSGEDYFYPLKKIMDEIIRENKMISVALPGSGPARNFKSPDGGNVIGFILSRSESFCNECNRLRLTSNGMLLPCLFSRKGVDLKRVLREGGDMGGAFYEAVFGKPAKHKLNGIRQYQYMNQIGG
ncbi:MAG: GTP 3',8-cyclase MoaA [Elusimicrobiota bacterium]|nr:GTP 3',8-cyclase MoaA [Elusimicrobiota bacterium]